MAEAEANTNVSVFDTPDQEPQGFDAAGELENYARQLARGHKARRVKDSGPTLLDSLASYRKINEAAVSYFRNATSEEVHLSYAAEWMLDNYYLIRQHLSEIPRSMPSGFYRQLPRLENGPQAGAPRVYSLARELLLYEKSDVSMDHVQRFLHAYQSECPLEMVELWAFPVMLRLGTLQGLAQSLLRLAPLDELEIDADRLPLIDYQGLISDEEVVAHSIVSLRALAAEDWKDIFESQSLVEVLLASDPAGIYAGMSFESRDQYRKVIEKLGLKTDLSEQEIARQAVLLAQQGVDQHTSRQAGVGDTSPGDIFPGWDQFKTPRQAHIGYYLVDDGLAQLEAAVGYQARGLSRLKRMAQGNAAAVYLSSLVLVTAILTGFIAAYTWSAGGGLLAVVAAGLLFLLPALASAVTLVNWGVSKLVKPRVLPKMAFEDGLPGECAALVVIPALISSDEEVDDLLEQLEQHHLRSRDANLSFALLSDFSDAPSETLEGDAVCLDSAVQGIQRLNERYPRADGSVFYLFHRPRRWNPKEKTWMGWERKRGKLQELNWFILGTRPVAYQAAVGDLDAVRRVRYIITLDADTVLPPGAARSLVATLAHPLNRAEFDTEGRVTAGYTILQPRTEILPTKANATYFTRIFTGDTGIDLYTLAVSDVYQDMFGEGIFVGKGIYDVAAFERSLAERIPENALLSHDLFEGIHGRAGLVTDIVLLEDYPPNYLASTSRIYRWIRGDWQLLPWLGRRVPGADGATFPNRLSVIGRWKILDNLRRSLQAPAFLAALFFSWTFLPGPAWVWSALVLLALLAPFLTGVFDTLANLWRGLGWSSAGRALRDSLARGLLALVFLPFEALVNVEAIALTLYRLFVRDEKLLEWTTAAQAARQYGKNQSVASIWREMFGSLLLSASLMLLVLWLSPGALWAAAPFLLAWLAAPQIAFLISMPLSYAPPPLGEDDRRHLRRLARQTWLFFEQFAGPEDHWLAPDHYQEYPRGVVAHRTSPTNIGLGLLAALGAHDLGYVGVLDMSARLSSAFDTIDGLEMHRGHILNWYDTRSLAPLPPRYVSTVDSGNLAVSLQTLAQGLLHAGLCPVFRWESWQGLLDSLDLLGSLKVEGVGAGEIETMEEVVASLRQKTLALQGHPEEWPAALADQGGEGLRSLDTSLVALAETASERLSPETLRRMRIYSQRIRHHLETMQREVDVLLPWLSLFERVPGEIAGAGVSPEIKDAWQAVRAALPVTPSLHDIPGAVTLGLAALEEMQEALQNHAQPGAANPSPGEGTAWITELRQALQGASLTAKALEIGLGELSRRAQEMASRMDFRFLFDDKRQVFHIGYNLDLGRPDANYYDLIASEARLASLTAIGKGDVPTSHWLHLGRPVTRVHGKLALLSWSATMFEYLMPLLFMRTYPGTLLHESLHAVVEAHIRDTRQPDAPWGISESGYYRFDENQNYQYRAFGLPGLGFKRGLGDDVVITPYASLLALPLRPHAVVDNLRRLEEIRMLGAYGLYEAIDYTEGRLPLGRKSARVQSYMAHHQGMILLSLVNYFRDNVMVDRFHSDPQIKAVELLLQEQIPHEAPLQETQLAETNISQARQPLIGADPWQVQVHTPQPRVHILSNGRFSTLITNNGAGYSTCGEVELTRWRSDTTRDAWGTWIYIQDLDSGEVWSAGYLPRRVPARHWDVNFNAHMVEFRRRDDDISTGMAITIPPEDDLEIRQVSLTNHTDQPRRLRVISYAEAALARQGSDLRHPAFSKLFVESEFVAEQNTLVFRRRPRKESEAPLFMAHSLFVPEAQSSSPFYETDRRAFLGRGNTALHPAAVFHPAQQPGSTGATLDPVFSLGQDIDLPPHTSRDLNFLTISASTREEALSLAASYHAAPQIERAFDQARTQAEVELRRLGLNTGELERIERLLSLLLFPHAFRRAPADTLAANRKAQPGLWSYSISGDYPVLLVRLYDLEDLSLAQTLLQAHTYWRSRQLQIDLVFVNQQGMDYGQELTGQLHRLLLRSESDGWLNRRGGIFVLHADRIPGEDLTLMETVARVVLDSRQGNLAEQLQGMDERTPRLPPFNPGGSEPEDETATPISRPESLLFDNGSGGFSPDGREYQVFLAPGQWTPAPWTNVIANPNFGFITTEAGGGSTWAVNSGENRLTPWSNDPVSDPPGDVIYLRDEETAQVWTPTPLPAGAETPYLVRHGAGYTGFAHHSHGLHHELRVYVSPQDPVKILRLRLENTRATPRRLTATFYAEWVLGFDRSVSGPFVITEYSSDPQAILARNDYNTEFAGRVAFAAASRSLHGLTADRAEFLGRGGSMAAPAALRRIGLGGTLGAGLDPCAALQVHIDLQPGEGGEVFFLLGQGDDREHSLDLVRRYCQPEAVEAAWQETQAFWDGILGAVQVETPDPAMDILLNRWLLYQALACRIWGRTAFYQSSGAYGFRDQLQDVMAVLYADPATARQHILRAARSQFESGDVLHWWHPPSGRGVRTRITDDLLFLPYVTAHYVEATGDESILEETAPFLRGSLLSPEEEERYGQFESTREEYSLFEHCRRAIEKGSTAGPHGLPLMGGGDWNDGMNRVGIDGLGESVWLGWFLYAALQRFAALCERRGETALASLYRDRAHRLQGNLEEHAWDGEWYRRAYYDDGSPLGSRENRECQIDAIAQSWAILSGAGDAQRARQAMQSVRQRLVRPDDSLLLLFTPPFDKTPRDPGYIKGYLPGIRENGGQYTHAATWTVWAFALLGEGSYAGELFRMLNPIYDTDTAEKAERYKVEPYVIAADIYSVPPHTGRGGWTWYTGASGWMYRLGLEALLGLRLEGDGFRLDPHIPVAWSGFRIRLRHGGATYLIEVENPQSVQQGVGQVFLNGSELESTRIPFQSGEGQHTVRVVLGNPPPVV